MFFVEPEIYNIDLCIISRLYRLLEYGHYEPRYVEFDGEFYFFRY